MRFVESEGPMCAAAERRQRASLRAGPNMMAFELDCAVAQVRGARFELFGPYLRAAHGRLMP